MSDSANVIRLEPDVKRHVRVRLARLPAAVQAFHREGDKALAALLQRLFDVADDAFFDLADKAKTNAEQNTFFDAMREVRVQRKGIEQRLFDMVDENFARLVGEDDRDRKIDNGEISADALALVDNHDLEQMVALEATISRARSKQKPQIQPLLNVLNKLVGGKADHDQYPYSAYCLCHGAMSLFKRLDVDLKAKLVLFQLFERIVINNLAELNKVLISCLTAEGITIEIDRRPKRPVEPQVGASARVELDSHQRELFTLLSFVQKLPVSASNSQRMDIKRVLSAVQNRRGVELKLGRVEEETIRLVEMLFNLILQGKNLAVPMQELICRLQIPVLKVALLDSEFLADRTHPARLLLNQMASVASECQGGIDDDQSQSVHQLLRSSIDRILAGFDSNLSIFNDVLADFASVVEKQRRAAEIREKRTVDAEDGKARAAQARQFVAKELTAHTSGKRLPSLVLELINGPWSNVLFVAGMKYGFQSSQWVSNLAVLSDLVESVMPYTTKAQRKKWITAIPKLLERMRAGLDAISYNPFEVEELFAGIEQIHLRRIRGENDDEELIEVAAVTTVAAPRLDAVADKSVESAAPATEIASSEVVETVADGKLPASDPHLIAVSAFVHGAWFDLIDAEAQVRRARLAAYIKPTDKYIFVDRSGAKVAEHTRHELALALKEGRLNPIDNNLLFDRALESVITSLRKPHNPIDIGQSDNA